MSEKERRCLVDVCARARICMCLCLNEAHIIFNSLVPVEIENRYGFCVHTSRYTCMYDELFLVLFFAPTDTEYRLVMRSIRFCCECFFFRSLLFLLLHLRAHVCHCYCCCCLLLSLLLVFFFRFFCCISSTLFFRFACFALFVLIPYFHSPDFST